MEALGFFLRLKVFLKLNFCPSNSEFEPIKTYFQAGTHNAHLKEHCVFNRWIRILDLFLLAGFKLSGECS